jgi:hypothetical protein
MMTEPTAPVEFPGKVVIHVDVGRDRRRMLEMVMTFDELETIQRALVQCTWELSDRHGRNDERTIAARALAHRIGDALVLDAVRR